MAESKKNPNQESKRSRTEKKTKNVRINRLIKDKSVQKAREKAALEAQEEQSALAKQEQELSADLFISPEEALGPTVYNERYLKTAGIYRCVRYGVILLLVVFLLGMLNFFREEITIENFRYLMRNVNFELRTELGETGSISYDSNSLNRFAVYKGSLAQISDRRLAIYDSTGRTSYTGSLNYSSPAICASEKYVLAYDRAGGAFSLYTGFSQAYADTTDYPITDVSLTDSGVFAIASRSKDYFGVVTVYSGSFQLMNKIQKNKYIASVDLSLDGKNLLIASYYIGESGIVTELMTLAVDSDEPTLLFTLDGILPWEARWMEDGRFVLICEEGVKFFDNEGKIFNTYGFSDKNVIEYKVSRSLSEIALLCAEGTKTEATRLILLDGEGKTSLEHSFPDPITAPTFAADGLILLSGNVARRITEDGKIYRYVGDSVFQAAAAGGETLYLCTYTRAVLHDPQESEEENS